MRNWRCELRREAVKEVPISGVSVTNHSTTAIPKASAWKPRLDEPLAGQCKVLARLCHFRPTILSSLVHLQEFLAILILFLCWVLLFSSFSPLSRLSPTHVSLECHWRVYTSAKLLQKSTLFRGISSNTICSLCWYAVFMFAVIKQTARALPQNSCNLGLK